MSAERVRSCYAPSCFWWWGVKEIASSCVFMMDLFPFSLRAVASTQTLCVPKLDGSIQTLLNITYILFHSSIDRACLGLYKCRQHLYCKIARWFLSTRSSFHYFYSSTLSIEISEMSLLFDSLPKSISGVFWAFWLVLSLPQSLARSQSPPHSFFPCSGWNYSA